MSEQHAEITELEKQRSEVVQSVSNANEKLFEGFSEVERQTATSGDLTR